MKRHLVSVALVALLAAACGTAPTSLPAHLQVPASTTQVLLSTTAGWDQTAATVQRLERTSQGWRAAGPPIAAQVGRSGLGWGLGHHQDGDGPTKREGDGRAPAGAFALGPAYGYAPAPPEGVAMPYRTATERDYFVDAADADAYNTWQRIPEGAANDPSARWSSFERMRRDDDLYELGVVVQHNSPEPVPGRGSAIFLHIWSSPASPTSGCTAMARADLLTVMRWLRPEAEPWLIQVPLPELATLRLTGGDTSGATRPRR